MAGSGEAQRHHHSLFPLHRELSFAPRQAPAALLLPSTPAPRGTTLLGEIRGRTTLAGELLHSPKAGKSHAPHLANVSDGCSLSWQWET